MRCSFDHIVGIDGIAELGGKNIAGSTSHSRGTDD